MSYKVQYRRPAEVRNKAPDWISWLRTGAFYTNFSITAPEFLHLL